MSSHGSIFGSSVNWLHRRIDWFTGTFLPTLIEWCGAIYFFRVPLLMFVLLMILFFLRESSMVSGLYGAAGTWRSFWLAFALTIVAGQIFVLTALLQHHGPERLKMALPAVLKCTNVWPPLLLSVVPAALNLWSLSQANQESWGYLLGGLSLGSSLLTGIVALTKVDPGSKRKAVIDTLSRALIVWIRRLDRDAIGFVREKKLTPELIEMHKSQPNHPELYELRENVLLASLCTLATALVYVVFGFLSVSAMFYVLLWLSLAGWLFGFLCIWLDRYRVPVFTLAAIWGVALSWLPWNSHYFTVLNAAPAAQTMTVDPTSLFPQNPPANSAGHIVIVSAEGGGIQAEAWTAEVLTGIADSLADRTQFLPAVRLMSGTSGGSVGIMFVDSLYESPRLNDRGCREAVRLAARDGLGLDWVAHGIVYYDLTRPVLPEIAGFEKRDRGFGLERAWQQLLQQMAPRDAKAGGNCGIDSPEKITIDSLRPGAAAGTQPLLVFNATYADSGWPLVVTNFDLADFSRAQLSGKHDYNGLRVFRERYGADLPLTTAVRLSASFPYVLPSPRALACKPSASACLGNQVGQGRELAVIDGGLYDNYGIDSAYETLKQATASFTDYHNNKVLWIRILASPEAPSDPNGDAYDPIAGSSVGPILSLYEVRDTEQVKRAEELTDIALDSSHGELQILKVVFPFCKPPLSWALTEEQAHDIDYGWEHIRANTVRQVERFFNNSTAKDPPDSPDGCQPAPDPRTNPTRRN